MFQLLRRFVPPYRGKLILNIFFNMLSAVLSLFSFAAIIPVLRILFGMTKVATEYVPVSWQMDWQTIGDALTNNLYCWIGAEMEAGRSGHVLVWLGSFLILMTGLKCGSAYLASYFMIPIRTGVLRDLRQQLYDKVLSLPVGFFTEEKKGDIMSRMTSDVNEVEASIMASLDMLFKNPILILVYLCMLLVLSWQLTLFVLILLPTAGWAIGRVGRSLKKRSNKGQEQTAELLTQIEETLSGLRVVQAFGAEAKLSERFSDLNNRTRQTFNRINRKYQLAHPMSEFLGTALIAVLLWYGGMLILSDSSTIDAAVFIYYLVLFYSIINPAKELSRATYSIRKGQASLERIDRILNVQSAIVSPDKALSVPQTFAPAKPIIQLQDVSFAYTPGLPVLSDINLSVMPGQTIALVGQSGSGKTTLTDLLPRFYDPQQGQVLLGGNDVRCYRLSDLRAEMGIVNQDPVLFNDTIYNNICFGVNTATQADVLAAAEAANALEFIQAMPDGFQTIVGDRGSRLSGGQRQRISIARAILRRPRILILDEATSALDTESERLVQQALDNLLRGDMTKIVVAHRLSTVRSADLICVLHEGRIVERGTHDELLALNGHYARLIALQQV